MRLSLEMQLVTLIMVVALGGVGVHALIVSGQSMAELEDSLASDRETTAALAARDLAEVLVTGLSELQTALAPLDMQDLEAADQRRLADQVDPLLAGAFSSVGLYHADGSPLYTRPMGAGSAPVPPGSAARLDALAPGVLAWTVPFPAGQGSHFAVALMKPSHLYDALFLAAGDHGIDILVLDSAGDVVISTAVAHRDGEPLSEASHRPEAQGLAATARIPGRPELSVVALGSVDDLAALRTRLMLSTLAVAVTIAGLAVVLGVALAKRVAHPIQHLSATAVRLRTGESTARAVPSGAREVRQLASELNALVDELDTERSRLLLFQKGLESNVQRRTQQLARERQALEEFAYVVSHDLRAPLRGISLQLELLSEELGDDARPPVHKAIERARERVGRLDSMIVGVLEYSRRGRIPTLMPEVRLTDLIPEVVDSLQPRGGLRVHWGRRMPTVKGDPVQIRQVFQNLIANALNHHDRHVGHVHVRATADNAFHIFTVEDDGPGVAPGDVARLFRMFGAGGAASSKTGVGLAVVRRIVESNGGIVRYEPRPDRGSRFIFTWPKIPLLADTASTSASSPASDAAVSVRSGRPRRVSHPDRQRVRQDPTSAP